MGRILLDYDQNLLNEQRVNAFQRLKTLTLEQNYEDEKEWFTSLKRAVVLYLSSLYVMLRLSRLKLL